MEKYFSVTKMMGSEDIQVKELTSSNDAKAAHGVVAIGFQGSLTRAEFGAAMDRAKAVFLAELPDAIDRRPPSTEKEQTETMNATIESPTEPQSSEENPPAGEPIH